MDRNGKDFLVVFLLILSSVIQVTFTLQESELTCSSTTLEGCTKHLLRYSAEDVKVPETEQEVKDNCA